MTRRTAAWAAVAAIGAALAGVLTYVGARSQTRVGSRAALASARVLLVDDSVATYAYSDGAGRIHVGQDRLDERVPGEMEIRYDPASPSVSCSERNFRRARERRWVAWGLAAASGLVAATAIVMGIRTVRRSKLPPTDPA